VISNSLSSQVGALDFVRAGWSKFKGKDSRMLRIPFLNSESGKAGQGRLVRQYFFVSVRTNLIGNAIKFTPNGGKVRLALEGEAQTDWLRLSVTDTGPGIPREEARRIFEEFYQVNRRGGEKVKGVGLGLAISKKLVEMHGGRITVESIPGAGSTFSFTLPARPAVAMDATMH